ncbi:MAG: hypothetical protein K8L97_17300 [Anaerolineae bacterium]|nr:hypothetical protein [Anaerolineae bacterium]
MITWRLWRAFKNPPTANPVFKRTISPSYDDLISWPPLLQNWLIQGQIWFWSLLFAIDMRALFLMVFSGTLYGAIWSVSISGRIAAERDTGTYDLLCLAPSGTIGTIWAICTGCLHRHHAFSHVNSQEAWTVRIILFIPLIISAHIVFHRATNALTIAWIVALIVVFYLDHVQSIILGSLFGSLAPYYVPTRLDNRAWAVAGFMIVQLGSYLLLILSILLLLILSQQLGMMEWNFNFPINWENPLSNLPRPLNKWHGDLAVPIVSVMIFYAVREYILYRLWYALIDRLNAVPTEFDSMFSQTV